MKIKGLNDREQKCYDVLCDGAPHTIAELKKKFAAAAKKHCEETYEKGSWDDDSIDIHAQSFVRNSLRRLIRDGWIEKKAYGTYQLTRMGKKWVTDGKDATTSFGVKRGRKPMSEEEKADAKAKKAKAPAKAKKVKTAKTTAKAKAAPAKPKTKVKEAPAKPKTKVKAAPAKPKTKAKAAPAKPKTKATNAKATNGKAEAKKKAKEAHKRAAKAASMEKAQQSLAEESSAS
jgi:hypothetical protein